MEDNNEEQKSRKKLTPEELKRLQELKKRQEEEESLRQFLINSPEELIVDKSSNQNLEREFERIQLIGGRSTSIYDYNKYVLGMVQPYKPQFPRSYYVQVCRLLKFEEDEIKSFRKKREFAVFTREVVYGRFGKEGIAKFHELNPYKGYLVREYKHFQFCNKEGIEILQLIIRQAIALMEECETMYEFRSIWLDRYGVSFQLSLFD